MHELAIADAVLTLALEQSVARRVRRIGMRIGHLRQVVPSSLRFGFELVSRGTRAEGAALEIEHIPVMVWCDRCVAESGASSLPLMCAQCGTLDVAVKLGDEMLVDWIEMED